MKFDPSGHGAYGPPPPIPSISEQKILESMDKGPAANVDPPWWCRTIARSRRVFNGSAIGFEPDGDE